MDGVARDLGGGVLGEGVVVVVHEVVVVVKSEAEETEVGDGAGSRAESDMEEMDVGDARASRSVGAGAD